MKILHKVLCTVLSLLLLVTTMTACGEEKIPKCAIVWMHGVEDHVVFEIYKNYVMDGKPGENIRVIKYQEISLEQFGQKAQAEIMTGAGPDLIHTTNVDMFVDVNKASVSGSFQSWDKLIKGLGQRRNICHCA